MIFRRVWHFATAKNLVPGLPPVKFKYLKENFGSELDLVSEIHTYLASQGLNKKEASQLIAKQPNLFSSDENFKSAKEVVQRIKTNYGLYWLNALSANGNLNEESIGSAHRLMKEELRLSDQQMQRILKYHPIVIHSNLRFNIFQKKALLRQFYDLSDQEVAQLVSDIPFLLNMKISTLRESIGFMKFVKFQKQQFMKLIRQYPQILSVDRRRLEMLLHMPKSWGISQSKVKQIIIANPLYLTICPFEIMPLKLKLLRHFEISEPMAKYIFENYPKAFILSVSSLEAKLMFLRQKLNISFKQVSDLFPFLLTLNYNAVLRPRGEILIKYAIPITRELFEISDEEFCQRNNINPQILASNKKRFKISKEMDYRKKLAPKIKTAGGLINLLITQMNPLSTSFGGRSLRSQQQQDTVDDKPGWKGPSLSIVQQTLFLRWMLRSIALLAYSGVLVNIYLSP